MKDILTAALFLGTVFVSATVVAGDLAGPRGAYGKLAPHGVDKYYFTVQGGKKMEFWVRGTKNWNLSAEVDDMDGNVVVADTCVHDSCHLFFEPALNAPVLVKVENNSDVEVSYRLASN